VNMTTTIHSNPLTQRVKLEFIALPTSCTGHQ